MVQSVHEYLVVFQHFWPGSEVYYVLRIQPIVAKNLVRFRKSHDLLLHNMKLIKYFDTW